ncbi:MAG TPA: glycoside hydrolase family 27 protein [Terriglobia bacterium]|nr:glycoside hydrolase family 27 protein [Terriglobia bacterium]
MYRYSPDRIAGLCLVFVALLLPSAVVYAQGNGLAVKPPMGWNSWYGNTMQVTDALIRAQADAMVENGMKALGYEYVNLDDGWQGARDARGVIHGSKDFPDMKALADYIHGKGLKFGVYSSPGPLTCGKREGSYRHEELDAQTYAAWGVDFLKYDWCSASKVYKPEEMQAAYKKMGDALKRTGRPMIYSLCQYGLERVWTWAPSVGGNMWRTTGDLDYNYDRVSLVGFQQDGLERFAGPGHWNDPDMLLVGLKKLNGDENRTQMSLWCLLAAPLLASADLSTASPATLAILTNPEVIAVDQDAAGVQGHRVAAEGPLEVWMKPLADGSKAVGLFNRGEGPNPVTVSFKDVGVNGSATVRDLWAGKDLGKFQDSFTADVPMYGVVLVKIR